MAVGIEQIAGPVNAGDIIMRDEEAPRGAAALLNKMINKGTQGMYKLPEQDKEMPSFMKDAVRESEQAAVDPSDFRTILRILEAGGNPEDYMEQTKLDASDFRTILKLLEQGFSMEDIENMTQASMLQDKAKTLNEAAPEGEMLAYINPEEAGVLKLLGGSGKMTEAGIPSFAIQGNFTMGGTDYSSPSQEDMNKEKDPIEQRKQAAQSMASVGLTSVGDIISSDKDQQQKVIDFYQDQEDKGQGGMSNQLAEAFGQTQAAKAGQLNFNTDTQTGKKLEEISAQNFFKDVLTSDNPQQTFLDSDRYKDINKLMGDFEPLTGNIGLDDFNILGLIKGLTSGGIGKKEEDRLFRDEDKTEMTREGFMKKLGEMEGGRDAFFNLVKRFDPKNFYKVVGMPQTSGSIKELADNQFVDEKKFKKGSKERKDAERYNRQIAEARMLRDKDKDNQQSQQGGGGAQAPADTPADDMPDPDERAGQFNVGGTMPYTDERTGNVEQFVPLGRRFQLKEDGQFRGKTPFTMDDVMKYATKGGFQQLEPFQEYLKRRKDFLGEEDPEYFDEEGNVIYGGPQ
jgi:hypothetical protein